MSGNIGRRKVRKRKNSKETAGMQVAVISAILILAVFLGYLTSKFVIGSIIGYNADESPVKMTSGDKISEELQDGYALQFGAFSNKDAAETLCQKLKKKSINTHIIEVDGVYKVVTSLVKDKNEAQTELEKIKESETEDVFIATF